jgi:hypothetical protein
MHLSPVAFSEGIEIDRIWFLAIREFKVQLELNIEDGAFWFPAIWTTHGESSPRRFMA